ncbi:hypothetical protein ACSX1A_20355 [Pontibacter sp. MBLB2868]|uniref:hypothetical protein n=1 Tax=Pontibacter sp. MBLB2868 TaxID=3451555 RepID=UPI003F751C15
MLYPQDEKTCVRYYYLSARSGNNAEIIEVLNSRCFSVKVPMLEEDVVLEPFHTRQMTPKESKVFRDSETWKVFSCWSKLYENHHKYDVEERELAELEEYRSKLHEVNNLVS